VAPIAENVALLELGQDLERLEEEFTEAHERYQAARARCERVLLVRA
jgi:hypothetical protein